MFHEVKIWMVVYCLFCLLIGSACAYGSSTAECLTCHSAKGFLTTGPDGKELSLTVDASHYNASVHSGLSCLDCHTDLTNQPYPHKTDVEPVQCGRCHSDGATAYGASIHGKAAAKGDAAAPACKDCHGYHNVRASSDPSSQTNRANLLATCGKCHSDSRIAKSHNMSSSQVVDLYEHSVHGRLVKEKGMLSAAVCTDCHGSHDIRDAKDLAASTNRRNVPDTCGMCHPKELEQYSSSVHGTALGKGVKDAPVCTDCHGEHSIQRVGSRDSSVCSTHVVRTCSKCHEDVQLQKKYGLAADRLTSYVGTFHGVANKYGETTVANCATCHGAHDILPSTNPHSAVNKKNLPKTCGKCHPGAGLNFARGDIHVVPTTKTDRLIYFVKMIYGFFVFGMIASFVGYIGLDLLHRYRHRGGHG